MIERLILCVIAAIVLVTVVVGVVIAVVLGVMTIVEFWRDGNPWPTIIVTGCIVTITLVTAILERATRDYDIRMKP